MKKNPSKKPHTKNTKNPINKNKIDSQIKDRKTQHIQLAKDPNSQIDNQIFPNTPLTYKALPELDLKKITTETTLLNKSLQQPLIIASMTGGTSKSKTINSNISKAAEETGIAFGVGSQRITLKNSDAKESFAVVRKNAPNAFIFANMGAVQLNYEAKTEDYQKVVDLIKADALYLHINPLQEAVQPEGDTNFENLLEKIHKLITKLSVPVFAKEVGHGIDYETAKGLINAGVTGIDVAGANGTSWAWIEAMRKTNSENFTNWFKDFGISTEQSLLNVAKAKKDTNSKIIVIASGGVRSPLNGLQAKKLGADFYSAAYPFLEPALANSPKPLINLINEWKKGLEVGMFCTGQYVWQE